MADMIENLWYGNIVPSENFGASNKKMRHIENLMFRNAENIMGNLSENQKKIFDEYNENLDKYIGECSVQAFCDGFRLGVRMISDALGDVQHICR